MIKENQKVLNRVQVIIDLVIIIISFLLAYYIRFDVFIGYEKLEFSKYLNFIMISIIIYFILYIVFEIYSPKRISKLSSEFLNILKVNVIAVGVLTLFLFISKTYDFPRTILLMFALFNMILTYSSRLLIHSILRIMRKNGYNLKHCIIIGTKELASITTEAIDMSPKWGYKIKGYISVSPSNDRPNKIEDKKILGKISEIDSIINENNIDLLFVAIDEEDYPKLGEIISMCEKIGVKTNFVPCYSKYMIATPHLEYLDGLPIIDIRYVVLDNYFYAFIKRSFDILFSLFALIILSPVMLISVIMVKLSSPGPIIFKQTRVGLNRKEFEMYKFRSMKMQTVDDEMKEWTTKNDPRKTKWGSFMRKTSIDEFPQFFNVLKGDMSVVGPRPERPQFVEIFKEEIPKYMVKHQVRPGITGLAQINDCRGDSSIRKRIKYDIYYIEHWNLLLDIEIILLTIPRGFINKNAY